MIQRSPFAHGRTGFSVLSLLILLLTGCEQGNNFRAYEDISNYAWEHDKPVTFEVSVEDTTVACNLVVSIRHTGQYRYRNVWLDIVEIAPDGSRDSTRQEVMLAEKDGRWSGEGLGDIIDREMLVRRQFRFSQTGTYRYRIRHAMRQDLLLFIMDVGLTVVEAE